MKKIANNGALDSRGEKTRQNILDAATELFAAHGYEGTSTRQIAVHAGVNQPAIQYYFASKEGLQKAVIEQIVSEIRLRTADAHTRLEKGLKDKSLDREALYNLLLNMIDCMASSMLENNDPESWGVFLSRAELDDSPALKPFNDFVENCIIKPSAALIARLTGTTPHDPATLFRTLAIYGQLLIFKNSCSSNHAAKALRFKKWTPALIAQLKSVLHAQTRAILEDATPRELTSKITAKAKRI